jgi:hypothetical protein
MDCPPHILNPLRALLLQTAAEEKVDTYLKGFYQQAAERRVRPLPNDFKELKLQNALSCWSDFLPEVRERLAGQVIRQWRAFYAPLARESTADSSEPVGQPPIPESPCAAAGIDRPVGMPVARGSDAAVPYRLTAGGSKVPQTRSGLPYLRSDLPMVKGRVPGGYDKVSVTRLYGAVSRGKRPDIDGGPTTEPGNAAGVSADRPAIAVEPSVAREEFFKDQDRSDWFDKLLDWVAALIGVFLPSLYRKAGP